MTTISKDTRSWRRLLGFVRLLWLLVVRSLSHIGIEREKKLFASTLNKREVEEESSEQEEPLPSTSHVKTEPASKRKGKVRNPSPSRTR